MNKQAAMKFHYEVFCMMEKVRKTVPGFYYGFRQKSSENFTLEDGAMFLSGSNYVYVPISTKSCPKNNTKTVGIAFIEEKGTVKAILEVAEPANTNSQEHEVYQQILTLGNAQVEADNKWYKRSVFELPVVGKSAVEDAQVFLIQHGAQIVTLLKSVKKSLAYDFDLYWKLLGRHAKFGSWTFSRA